MTFVDHLKGTKQEDLFLEVAFGLHVIAGDLSKSIVTGSSPTHVVKIQQMLGDALGKGWKGVVGLWFRGINRDSTKYKFYPGIMSPGNGDSTQGIDSVFDQDTPHSNKTWIRVECPNGSETGIPDFDTKNNPPTGLVGIYECQLGDIYDENGDVIDSDVLLVNPADVIIFGLKEILRADNSRIDFESLDVLRGICDQTITPNYTTLLPQGVGLTGKYYDGTNFDTFKSKRVDPVIQFDSSSGAPALDINVDAFSVRWEGKIRPRYSQTYTFYINHDNGAKLWVNGSLIIDQWNDSGTATPGEHSATIALTANQFYDIRLDWNEGGSVAYCKLEWQSTSQSREVVPQDRLYPKAEALPRFRTHVAFTERTTFDDFLRQVLFTCNGSYQDVNGKLTFFCFDELEPSFDFDESNIIKNTFNFYPRYTQQELLKLPNRFVADGRDLDSRYLEKFDPPLFYDVSELQEIAGRIIEETVSVGNVNRYQGLKNLEHYAKMRVAPVICEFEGMPQTYPVLQGDLVRITHPLAGWEEKQFLCLEATDKSIDDGADERIFKLLDWSFSVLGDR